MIEDNIKIFRALSDLDRLRILKALQLKVLCECEIKELLGLTKSTISKHLGILKESGFVLEQKNGKWFDYTINPKPKDARISTILATIDYWIADEKIIISDKLKIKTLDRKNICCN